MISITDQLLLHYRGIELHRSYTISTSRRPPSCQMNSQGTPWGLHRITEKIGSDAPLGMVFVGRKPTGKSYREMTEEENRRNLITTRILRMEGLEPGINRGGDVDTFKRLVYIHGTNREEQLGSPASAGCVVLSNTDAADLFDEVPAGTLVWIQPPGSTSAGAIGEEPDRVS